MNIEEIWISSSQFSTSFIEFIQANAPERWKVTDLPGPPWYDNPQAPREFGYGWIRFTPDNIERLQGLIDDPEKYMGAEPPYA